MSTKTKRKSSGIRPGCKEKPGLKIQKCANGIWGVLANTGRVVAEFMTEQEAEMYLREKIANAKG